MRLIIYCAIFFILGIAALQSPAYADDFNADVVTSAPEGSVAAKIYVSGNKSRMEAAEMVTISRLDRNVVWILMPAQKMYMEQPVNPRAAANVQEKVDGEIERSAEGAETVNGVKTTKYRITVETQGRRESIFQWIDEAMRFPIKTAAIDGSWSSEFKNIRKAPQDPQLFEIPAGYTKMSVNMPDMNALMNKTDEGNDQ
jgi:hypothetical protein